MSTESTAHTNQARFFPLRTISLRTATGALLLGLGVAAPLIILASLLPAAPRPELKHLFEHPWRWFAMSVFMGPLIEELIFRGLILQLLRRYTPNVFAAVVSAALFAGLHAMRGWGNVVNAMIMGLVFAWMVIRTESLLPSLICHPVINFTALFVLGPLTSIRERVLSGEDTSTVLQPTHGPMSIVPLWATGISLAVFVLGLRVLAGEFAQANRGFTTVK